MATIERLETRMHPKLMTLKRAAQLLRVHHDSLPAMEGPDLEAVIVARTRHYRVSQLNELLARSGVNLIKPVTVQQIASGEVELLTPKEAMQLSGWCTQYLYDLLSRGELSAIRPVRYASYIKASIVALMAQRDDYHNMRLTTVEKIFGQSRVALQPLFDDGTLVDVSDGHKRRCTRESVMRALRLLLPAGSDLHDWMEDRLHDDRPLKPIGSLALATRHVPRLNQAMDDGELAYICAAREPNSYVRLIPQDAWETYIFRTDPIVGVSDLAKLFGVVDSTIYGWRRDNPASLACTAHRHSDDTLYYTCAILLLRRYMVKEGGGRSAIGWHTLRVENDSPVITPTEGASMLGISFGKMIRLLRANTFYAIQTPGGGWSVMRVSVANYAKQQTLLAA